MVGHELGLVVGSPGRADPTRDSLMLLRARCTRDLAVRNVPDQHVPEREFRLAADRRRTRALHELLALERMEKLLGLPPRDTVDCLDGAHPEDLPDYRSVL